MTAGIVPCSIICFVIYCSHNHSIIPFYIVYDLQYCHILYYFTCTIVPLYIIGHISCNIVPMLHYMTIVLSHGTLYIIKNCPIVHYMYISCNIVLYCIIELVVLFCIIFCRLQYCPVFHIRPSVFFHTTLYDLNCSKSCLHDD